jgi:putative oxidoreductase
MSKWLNSLQPWGALLMRLLLCASMLYHGYDKVIPHAALSHWVHYISTLGLPAWLGYVSAFTEVIGGVLLLLGLFTRLAAAFVAINMYVAFFTVGIHQGFDKYTSILALAVIATMLLFYGAGALALDRKIGFA